MKIFKNWHIICSLIKQHGWYVCRYFRGPVYRPALPSSSNMAGTCISASEGQFIVILHPHQATCLVCVLLGATGWLLNDWVTTGWLDDYCMTKWLLNASVTTGWLLGDYWMTTGWLLNDWMTRGWLDDYFMTGWLLNAWVTTGWLCNFWMTEWLLFDCVSTMWLEDDWVTTGWLSDYYLTTARLCDYC